MDTVLAILTIFTQPQLLLLLGIGTFAGIYIGAIRGLSVTMAVSIRISFTFSWHVDPAIFLMVGIYMGGVLGGSRTAIPLNIPGAPSAIATAMDGYPMAKRGEAGQAIGVTTVMSFFGGLIGIGALALAAPLVSDFAMSFQPRDYMLLAVPGILLAGSLSSGRLIGALPGTGGDIVALMAYDHAQQITKNPERPFGEGAMEGLVAPETAKNAAVGGASRLLDDDWRRAIISERENLGRFFDGILGSPLSLTLFFAVILIFVSQTPLWTWAKTRLLRKSAR